MLTWTEAGLLAFSMTEVPGPQARPLLQESDWLPIPVRVTIGWLPI
jgi:hypothetical protein